MEKALNFAKEKHINQFRRGTKKPYIVHPIDVFKFLYCFINKEEKSVIEPLDVKIDLESTESKMLQAALLHDTLEDTDASIDELQELFGLEVAKFVEELTSDKDIIKLIGKNEYLKEKMAAMSEDTLSIKLCDRLSNILDLPSEKYKKDTKDLIIYLFKVRTMSSMNREICREILIALGEI